MRVVYIVTTGAKNKAFKVQFAFHDRQEAYKFREYLDSGEADISICSTVQTLHIYDKAVELMNPEKMAK